MYLAVRATSKSSVSAVGNGELLTDFKPEEVVICISSGEGTLATYRLDLGAAVWMTESFCDQTM